MTPIHSLELNWLDPLELIRFSDSLQVKWRSSGWTIEKLHYKFMLVRRYILYTDIHHIFAGEQKSSFWPGWGRLCDAHIHEQQENAANLHVPGDSQCDCVTVGWQGQVERCRQAFHRKATSSVVGKMKLLLHLTLKISRILWPCSCLSFTSN